MTGVHTPSSPDSARVAGCKTLVGQTLMHMSHLMQRSRNSGLGHGARWTDRLLREAALVDGVGKTQERVGQHAGDGRQDPAAAGNGRDRLISVSGRFEKSFLPNNVAAPAVILPTMRSLTGTGASLNDRASSGQSSMQLKQTKHSLLRRASCGSARPRSACRHRSQSVHLVTSRSMRQSEKRESTPSMAPRGHSTRQKNRGMTRFMPTRPMMSSPTNQAPAKTRWSGAPGDVERTTATSCPGPTR